MGRVVDAADLAGVFCGSEAVIAGVLTREQLRGPQVRRLFRDVYVPAGTRITHALRCEGGALVLPPGTVLTGRSAATLRGVPLAGADDPVELVVPLETRVTRRRGFDLRRTEIGADDWEPWFDIGLATPLRMALDLLLDRELPDAVADLDAVLRAGLVSTPAVQSLVARRHDRGIVRARRAAELADPRAESPQESRMRVWLVLDALAPEPQYWVHDAKGRIARVDLAFPGQQLAVEYDGEWHGEWLHVGRDRERLNRLHAAGWEVVFVTARHLRNPQRMVRTVHAALGRRAPQPSWTPIGSKGQRIAPARFRDGYRTDQ